jgi:transcription elongation GreA/GreB family factor
VSRAFVKDDDDRPERPPARAVGDRPNYVTERGLAQLREALEQARAQGDARNVEYFEGRIASAELPKKPKRKTKRAVEFGSTVVVREDKGGTVRLRIVGEDEADPMHGSISWISPYAQALLGHRAGERVIVQRPAGAAPVTIESVESD